jgi:beta-lactamase class A
VPVAHKSGQLPGVRHDAGVVYGPGGPYVVVVLTDDLADQGEAEAFIAGLARDVYDHFRRA